MMKKLVLGVTVAALVGVSSSCFAGFGVPKMPGAKPAKPAVTGEAQKDEKLTKTSQAVDLNDMMAKQKQMTQLMISCNNYAVDAWVELNNSTGNDVTGLIELQKKLRENPDTAIEGDELTSAQEDAAKIQPDPQKVKVNKAAVEAAIAKAKELKVTAENERTKAATMLPAATAEIGKATKNALSDMNFAKQFKPVKKAFDLNKKLLTASDKNLKNINARIAELEKLLK